MSPSAAGYIQDGTLWWAPSGTTTYATTQFYLPSGFTDPFGTVHSVGYDPYWLLPLTATSAVGTSYATTTSFQNDYRVLCAAVITDANQNQTQASYDALGRVIKAFVMGKVGENIGDDLTHPSMVIDYYTDSVPVYVVVTKREQHFLTDPTNTKSQVAYSYTDGLRAGGADQEASAARCRR